MTKNYKLQELISENQLKEKVIELGKIISKDYENSKSLILIGLLRGSIIFVADLIREIKVSNSTIDFISVSSYGNSTTSSKNVKIIKDTEEDIKDKDVLIVEDIVDTGYTLNCIKKLLLSKSPKSLKICTLLDKPEKREIDIPIDYRGFVINDYFVVGYGIDFAQQYRSLKYIAKITEEDK